jgi:hypothetical protein
MMKLRFKPKPGVRAVKTPRVPSTIVVHPKNAVKMPTVISTNSPVVSPKKPVVKPPPRGISSNKITVTRSKQGYKKVTTRPRTRTDVRPSHLRRAHDKLMGKHTTKIRELRGSGRGRVLVILACGPSVNRIPVNELVDHPKIDIMCINKPEMRVWPSKFWMFCDQSQYNRNKDHWADYKGTIINASSVRASHPKQVLIKTIAGKGFSRDMTKGLHIGRSTTYAAMQVSLYLGYDKVYILGCDMGEVDGQMHRYGQNPDVTNENRARRFGKEAEHFTYGTNSLKDYEKSKFTFCSEFNKFDFVDQFNRENCDDTVPAILSKAKELMTQKELSASNIE